MRTTGLAVLLVIVARLVAWGDSAAQTPIPSIAPPAASQTRPVGLSLLLPVVGPHAEDFGYPIQTIDRLVVRRFLLDRSYGALDTLLAAYADSAIRDYRLEYRLFDAYGGFEVAMPMLEPLLTEWVHRQPASAEALLARASFLLACGWTVRGGGWAKDTPPQQLAGMGNFFALAMEDLAAALRLSPNSLVAYRDLIVIATSQGDAAASRKALDRALTIQPFSFLLRAAHMVALEPRWGGSYEAMADFAAESSPYAERNPRIEALQGFADWDRGRVLAADGEKVEALQEFQEAIRLGNFWQFRFERGLFYAGSDRYAEALEDLTTALVQRPQHPEMLFHRALVELHLGRQASGTAKAAALSQGFRDIELAAELDPTDEHYRQLLAFYRDSLPEFAPSARP